MQQSTWNTIHCPVSHPPWNLFLPLPSVFITHRGLSADSQTTTTRLRVCLFLLFLFSQLTLSLFPSYQLALAAHALFFGRNTSILERYNLVYYTFSLHPLAELLYHFILRTPWLFASLGCSSTTGHSLGSQRLINIECPHHLRFTTQQARLRFLGS